MDRCTVLVFVLASLMATAVIDTQQVKASSTVIIVPDDYATIQTAISNATEGDTIYVKKGTYWEGFEISKPLTLIGENKETTIMTGSLTVTQDNVTISGFTFSSIQLRVVSYCNISGNKITGYDSGVQVIGTPPIFASYNTINGNDILSTVEGVLLSFSSNNKVTGNNILNSSRTSLVIRFSNDNIISENNIANSESGITVFGSDNNVFHRNNFVNNTRQVLTSAEPAADGGVRFSLNMWEENFWSDYNGTDSNGNGIGDAPYIINEKNADNRPLMEPFDNSNQTPTSPSPTPNPTPNASTSATQTPSQGPSQSPASSEYPTQSPEPLPTTLPTELVYATAIVAAVVIAATVVFVFRKKQQI